MPLPDDQRAQIEGFTLNSDRTTLDAIYLAEDGTRHRHTLAPDWLSAGPPSPGELTLLTWPDPRLDKPSRAVTGDELGQDLVDHMLRMTSLCRAIGAIGLAGVQVGDCRRLMVSIVGTEDDDRDDEILLMVNPEITTLETTMPPVGVGAPFPPPAPQTEIALQYGEGCMSYPLFTWKIQRKTPITVAWIDPSNGERVQRTFTGKDAILVQHELDHLDGKTVWSRASRSKQDDWLATHHPQVAKQQRMERRTKARERRKARRQRRSRKGHR